MAKLAKVKGIMYVGDGHNGRYTESFNGEYAITDEVQNIGQARSFLRKSGIVHDALRDSVKNFKRIQLLEVLELVSTDKKLENAELQALTKVAIDLGCNVELVKSFSNEEDKIAKLNEMIEKQKARNEKNKKKQSNIEDHGFID